MRPEKQYLLDEIKDKIENLESFVILNYFGLEANKINDFRNEIAKIGGDVEFVRKKLLIKAAQEEGIELTLDMLPGHIGLVFSKEDPLSVAKAVFKLKKDTNKAVDVLGGRIDGSLYDATQVEKLSKLPNLDEMRAQLLSVFVAPMAQTVGAMNAVMQSIVNCLEQKSKKES
jgi:large subunit ribosomal protein L10